MKDQRGIGTLLRSLLHGMDGQLDLVYESRGLPFRARFFPIYKHLLVCGGCPMRDLVERTGTSFSAVSQTVDQMKKLSLIESRPGEDRRVKLLTLTEEAKQLRSQLEGVWSSVERAIAELDEEIGGSLHKTLSEFSDALNERSFYNRIESAESR